MPNDTLMIEIERRLALAERELETTRAQVRTLQAGERSSWRRRRDGVLGVVAVSLVLFAATRAISTQAQGAAQGQTVKAPFQVVDAAGKVILRAEAGPSGPLVTIGDGTRGHATLGVGASGAGFVVVSTRTGTDGVALGQYRGGSMGAQVIAPDGQTVAAGIALDSSNKGQLAIGDLNSGGVSVGVGQSGAGYAIVRRPDGKSGLALGQLEGRPMSLGLFGDNNKELVTLGTGQKGGSVKAMTAAGVPVAALLAGDSGGGIALTGPAGGKSAISLAVESTGGKVRVFPQAGGSTQAELTAASSGGGSVIVYNPAGQAVAWVESTSKGEGSLEIGRAGTTYVKAGVMERGVGMVATGPQVGGAPVGMVLPNILVGRTGGK